MNGAESMDNKEEYRIERDSLGEVKVPKNVWWGAQTQRSLENFRISGTRFPILFLDSLIRIKRSCARANIELKELSEKIGKAIIAAADKIINDQMWDQFPLDVYQTGSGTQTNMNANEVIANIANEILGGKRGEKKPVHPNDHVNKGQSSNDIIPTAMNVSTARALQNQLIPTLKTLRKKLEEKAIQFKEIIKIGRTHLQDAVPITLGQEFSGYAAQLRATESQLELIFPIITFLPIGGTAVGTGLNAHPKLAKLTCRYLSDELGISFKPSQNKFSQIAAHDELVTISGILKTLAAALIKIGNDIRLLASGPRCGLGELILPVNEPGSSIMPGKVNPTQVEALVQACLRVIGNDQVIAMGGFFGGQIDLNTTKPLMIYTLLESITLLSNSMKSFTEKCVEGIKANRERISFLVNQSLMLVTALTPHIGYDKAAKIAQKAYKEGKTIRQVVLEEKLLTEEELDNFLNLHSMVHPWDDK